MAFSPYCLLKLPKHAGQTKEPGEGARLPALPLKGFKESMSLPSHVFPYIFS